MNKHENNEIKSAELVACMNALESESQKFFNAYSQVMDIIDKNTRYYDCGFGKRCVAEVDPRSLKRKIQNIFENIAGKNLDS